MNWWTLAFSGRQFPRPGLAASTFPLPAGDGNHGARKGEVDRAYAEAAAAKAAADSARTEYEGMRADAAKEAARMMDEAKEAALRERNAMMDQARADAENIARGCPRTYWPRT